MPGKRSYDDGCAAAHALDLIGERWALLVVRELLFGPRRFTDLRAALPGISPNVLSQRLKDLEDIGVLNRTQLPPPAASWVYELTPWGQQLEPILQQLGRWGAQSPTHPLGARISVATGLSALKTMFDPALAPGLDATIALHIGRETYQLRFQNGQLVISRQSPTTPDAAIGGELNDLRDVIFAGVPLATAEQAGKIKVEGDQALVQKFVTLFPLPAGAAQ